MDVQTRAGPHTRRLFHLHSPSLSPRMKWTTIGRENEWWISLRIDDRDNYFINCLDGQLIVVYSYILPIKRSWLFEYKDTPARSWRMMISQLDSYKILTKYGLNIYKGSYYYYYQIPKRNFHVQLEKLCFLFDLTKLLTLIYVWVVIVIAISYACLRMLKWYLWYFFLYEVKSWRVKVIP